MVLSRLDRLVFLGLIALSPGFLIFGYYRFCSIHLRSNRHKFVTLVCIIFISGLALWAIFFWLWQAGLRLGHSRAIRFASSSGWKTFVGRFQ